MGEQKNSNQGEDLTNFFDFAAEVGLTKLIDGQDAADTLVELCRRDAALDISWGSFSQNNILVIPLNHSFHTSRQSESRMMERLC